MPEVSAGAAATVAGEIAAVAHQPAQRITPATEEADPQVAGLVQAAAAATLEIRFLPIRPVLGSSTRGRAFFCPDPLISLHNIRYRKLQGGREAVLPCP